MKNMEAAERLRALYDAAPYPDSLQGWAAQNNPLLTHWINAVQGFDAPVLANGKRFLVAGCGTGAEVLALARMYPSAYVVGIDFSSSSIERAKAVAESQGIENVLFQADDLMREGCASEFAPFDFVLCHGVADYVADPAQLLRSLAKVLAEKGLIFLSANSPYHPAMRIRRAFEQLGQRVEDFEDSDTQRSLLQLCARLMGADAKILGLGAAPKAYLDIDIFAPIAHHDAAAAWVERAAAAGLHFSGSMDAPFSISTALDAELPLLYALDKAELSLWFAHLQQRPAMQLLFCKEKPTAPNFADLQTLLTWRPRLAACLGTLPDLQGAADEARNLLLRFESLPEINFVIYSSAYDLAVLRRCDGSRSLGEILAEIPATANINSLRACLFRAYHYGLLSN